MFLAFLMLGLTGFGGVLPMLRDMLVERRRWLNPEAFTELLGVCQFMPGGNAINMSVAVGLKFRGVPGALAGLLGILAAPTVIVIGLGVVYARYADDPHLRHFFAGLAAAAAGLLISTTIKIGLPLRRRPVGLAIAALVVLAVAVLRLPLVPTLLVMAPLGILASWRFER
ncbi:chromate transporter [Bosea sp. PAMC 26642]|nr:chromate transporter [Bosea sp. PAMC 26642]